MIIYFDTRNENEIYWRLFHDKFRAAFEKNNDVFLDLPIATDEAAILQKVLRRLDPAPEDLEGLLKDWTPGQDEDGEEFYSIPSDKARRIYTSIADYTVGFVLDHHEHVLEAFLNEGAITQKQYRTILADWEEAETLQEDPEEGAAHEHVEDT